MIKFIQHYWFHTFIGLMLFVFITIAILVLLSPKQDMQGRGFVPCTEKMIENLFDCNQKLLCSAGAVVENNFCVSKVIGLGFSDWLKGNQPLPWSNYIFEPELYSDSFVDKEAVEQYLKEHPDVKAEMKQLHRLRKDMENENNKQINSEGSWNEEK